MAISLHIENVDGLKLRHQTALKVKRVEGTELSDGAVLVGTEWRFEKDPVNGRDAEVPRDLDRRTQAPLNTFSPVINYGTRNLVVECKGKVAHIPFRNNSVRQTLRIKYQDLAVKKVEKHGKEIEHREWKDGGTEYVPAGQWGGVAVGDGRRAILDEMPT